MTSEANPDRTQRLLGELQALVHVGVWEWNVRTNQLYWSDELYQIIGRIPGEMQASFDAWLSHVHPDDLSTAKSWFSRSRKESYPVTCEYRIVRPSGDVRTVQARLRPIFGSDGALEWIIGVDQDVTETKEVQARQVFSDRMMSVGTLAGGVAHEINNPLATVSASIEMLAEKYKDADVRDARQAVERIRTIVRGLGAFSRVEDDTRNPVDINRIMELAITMANHEIRQRARLVKSLGAIPHVMANEARLGHVFLNLLVNAAEAFTDGDATNNEVRVSTRTDDAGWVLIQVTDNGGGIASDAQSRIFDPFFTTKAVGQGTGLGLSIVHGTVRALGGDVTFASEVGKGTSFMIALPPTADAPRRRTKSKTPKVPLARRGTLLIVDDDTLFTSSLRRMFSVEHDVTVVNDGRDALERLKGGERYDVILCDLMMPHMTGAELHAAIRDSWPDIADEMIFITGGAFTPASQQFLERITNLCFEKPCDLGELRSAVRRRVAARTK